jgi:hypothetical protein
MRQIVKKYFIPLICCCSILLGGAVKAEEVQTQESKKNINTASIAVEDKNTDNLIASETEVDEHEISESPIEEIVATEADDISEILPPEEVPFEEGATDSEILKVVEEPTFEKAENLDPVLIVDGAPEEEELEEQTVEFSGKIIPEMHPVKRRKFFYRWVLELKDGTRIPLKSNLMLLQKVKDEEVLDGFVTVKGQFREAKTNPDLKFLKIEFLRKIDELPVEKEESAEESISEAKEKQEEGEISTEKPNSNDSEASAKVEEKLESETKTTASATEAQIVEKPIVLKNSVILDRKFRIGDPEK